MKKNYLWLAALFAALALVFSACGGDTLPPDDKQDEPAKNWYLSAEEGGSKVANNAITITEVPTEIYVYFDPLGKDFQKLKMDFTATPGVNMTIGTALYEEIDEETYTWGFSPAWETDYHESGPFDIDFAASRFASNWSSSPNSTFSKANIYGFCINIAAETTFVLTGLTFIGVGKGSEPPEPPGEAPYAKEDKSIQLSFKTDTKTATLKGTGFNTVGTDGKMKIDWNPNDEGGAFRAKVEIATADQVDLSSGYSKFKMNWSGTATNGSFNISLYFPDNRMLSKTVSSGAAEFSFTADHPSWAAGTEWGGAAVGTITGFEIFSDDDDSLGTGTLVISDIGFE
ncbi:MAG: hypothetical protein LBH20_02275 [Treponema sp.]|jgi:hypothetical protein|nr:hypothetical protein [Treponema sp.]